MIGCEDCQVKTQAEEMIPGAVYKNLRKPKAQGEEPRLSISGIVTMKVRGLTEY